MVGRFLAIASMLGRSQRNPAMDSDYQVIEAARDLIRARKRELVLEPFLSILENAISQASDDEFDEWCAQVDEIVSKCMGDRGINEERRVEWDYSAQFNQGLTRVEGADRLYQFLLGVEP
jgi:hypothetical protein